MKSAIQTLPVEETIAEFKEKIKKLYGPRLKQVILYGSWARGEATPDSDIDLLVILAGNITPGHEIDRMIDIVTELNLKYQVLISIYPISEANYTLSQSPLLINVRREGIPI
jgi:predicted nucleotidyltransferase